MATQIVPRGSMAQRGSHSDIGDGGPLGGHGDNVEHASHPTARFYVLIFFILLAITIAEVFVAQEPFLGIFEGIGVPIAVPLLILAAAKFLMIAAFYMHLKQDSRAFSAFLIAGLILAIGMLFTFGGLFTAHSREPFDQIAWREQLAQNAGTGGAGGAGATTGRGGH